MDWSRVIVINLDSHPKMNSLTCCQKIYPLQNATLTLTNHDFLSDNKKVVLPVRNFNIKLHSGYNQQLKKFIISLPNNQFIGISKHATAKVTINEKFYIFNSLAYVIERASSFLLVIEQSQVRKTIEIPLIINYELSVGRHHQPIITDPTISRTHFSINIHSDKSIAMTNLSDSGIFTQQNWVHFYQDSIRVRLDSNAFMEIKISNSQTNFQELVTTTATEGDIDDDNMHYSAATYCTDFVVEKLKDYMKESEDYHKKRGSLERLYTEGPHKRPQVLIKEAYTLTNFS